MADRKHGEATPQTTSTIRAEDWPGHDLDGETYQQVEFVDVDMMELTSNRAVFTECTFRGVRLNVSAHTSTAFLNCTFARCTFFNATFTGCKLTGSMFDRCSYGPLTVAGGDWSFVGLPGADLSSASFTDVRMREADLTGAQCQGATLRRVDLSGAWLHRADLSGADLRGSDLTGLDPLTTGLRGAIIDPYQSVVIVTSLGLEVRDD
jgi:fluoroquinolone resistance protein